MRTIQMKLLRIVRSPVAGKKWEAQFETDTGRIKHVSFGDATMEDYTQHRDPERARLYRARHAPDLETGDPTRPGYLSYYVLWATPNFDTNVRLYKKRFNL
jgi:hypothetical protein